jgi:proteasome lid subunit RPN8/RPN11
MGCEALRMAERVARRSPDREAGGLLVGFRTNGRIHVEDVIAVRDPAASRTRFVLREDLREDALRRYRRGLPAGSPLGYVGTWHSHLADVGPSRVDRWTFRQELWDATDMLALIVVAKRAQAWGLVGLAGRPRLRLCRSAVHVV